MEYNEGLYFVTICTNHMIHRFGEIHDGIMDYSPVGHFVDTELSHSQIHHPYIEVPLHVVMPNHLYAIVAVGTRRAASASDRTISLPERSHMLLSTYIASLKSAVTRFAHTNGFQMEWQTRYHDHAIRGTDELNNIAQYIKNNVARWETDRFFS